VHDDLPAMDNDEYRRGRKTTHVVYGEALAILAGDGLLNYAYETAIHAFEIDRKNENIVAALSILAEKAGIYGMIGGQTVDIESVGQPLTADQLRLIFHLKTAALIEGSMMIGAVLAGASKDELMTIRSAANDIGIAFQIQDDILDVTSTVEVLGKPTHSDERNDKSTYVTIKGIEQSKKDVKDMTNRAMSAISSLGRENEFLFQLVTYLINRVK